MFHHDDPKSVILKDDAEGDRQAKAMLEITEPKKEKGSDKEQDAVIDRLRNSAVSDHKILCRIAAISALGRFEDPRSSQILVAAYDSLSAIAQTKEIIAASYTSKRPATSITPDQAIVIKTKVIEALGKKNTPEAINLLCHEANKKEVYSLKKAARQWIAPTLLIFSACSLLLVWSGWYWILSSSKNSTICHDKLYPVGAVQFIKEHSYPGPLFNDFDWGGYLIWNLPDYPVAVDGRTNFYGEKLLKQSMASWSADASWEQDPALARARLIIAPKKREDKEFPLTELLRSRTTDWRLVYEDHTALVFVRVGHSN